MPEKNNIWNTVFNKLRDIIFIILFIATSLGWIITSNTNKTETRMILQRNTEAVNDLKEEIKKVNDFINRQAELNGQILQYMRER